MKRHSLLVILEGVKSLLPGLWLGRQAKQPAPVVVAAVGTADGARLYRTRRRSSSSSCALVGLRQYMMIGIVDGHALYGQGSIRRLNR